MEKELNCPTSFGMEISCDQIPNCYFQSNWDISIDQTDPFESALSSMVSSPTAASNGGGMILGDGMMRELIGRLGSISDCGEISCIATGNNSTNTSCYSTPSNSPPKTDLMMMGANGNFSNYPPNLPPLNADPGFVERAAKFSSFGSNNFSGGELEMNNIRSVLNLESGKLYRVSSNQSVRVGEGGNWQIDVNSGGFEKKFGKISRASSPENGEMGDSREGSSLSEQNPIGEMGLKAQNDANSRKRKSISKAKVKESPSSVAKDEKVEQENEKSNAKRSKPDNEEGKKQNAGDSNTNKDKQNNSKETAKPEPPKDYIHVRARRGQATDSHSLAERVRREKISERMKFLQDLVPGCNKVTGKATVLDEIINYVQSLQRQVEFLSMKLANFNPRMEFNPETLLSKDMFQSKGSSTIPQIMYQLEQNSAQAYPLGYQSFQQLPSPLANVLPNGTENPFSLNPLNVAGIRRNPAIQLPSIAGFGDSITQMPNFWEDDLQSIIQMGIAQNQTKSVPGTLLNAQMKLEL